MAFSPATPTLPNPSAVPPYDPQNIRVIVNKVARALYGPTYNDADATINNQQLTADQLRDTAADAIAKIIFYTNGMWPYTLQVELRDTAGVPQEYSIQPHALPLPEETLIVAQAALDFFFHEFKDKKVTEEISDVAGQKWTYGLSATTLLATYNGLRTDRDKALEIIERRYDYLTDYVSFIAERDALTSATVEWWVRPGIGGPTYPSGQEIFPSIAAFGG